MIQCFWLEETDAVARFLRRYSRANDCPGHGYHNAMTRIEDDVARAGEMIDLTPGRSVDAFVADDRWPSKCEHCARPFIVDEEWQVFSERIYRRADNGELVTLRDVPPGAMWNAWWIGHRSEMPKPDEIRLMVKTPDGDWYVDGKASNGPGWTRTGDPRANPSTVTATPSIAMQKYHGWLRDGRLVDA
jgi:hypothetical protein